MMRCCGLVVLFSLAGCVCAASVAAPEPAELILTNARVYTLDWPDPARDGILDPASPHRGRVLSFVFFNILEIAFGLMQ